MPVAESPFPTTKEQRRLTERATFILAIHDRKKREAEQRKKRFFAKQHRRKTIVPNGTWEVDDAINTAGKQFDLRIEPTR